MAEQSPPRRAPARPVTGAAIAFLMAAAAGLGMAAVYWHGGQPQLEGLFLAVMLGAMGYGLVLWSKQLMPGELVVEEHKPLPSPPRAREQVGEQLESDQLVGRRRLLGRLLGGAVAAAVVAFLFPIRSLGPRPGNALFVTPWRRGRRMVDSEGRLVRGDDLEVGAVLTVFPEHSDLAADAQALLLRVEEGLLTEGTARLAHGGLVAYSKLCTHLACPVGLFQRESHLLLCPCHQSTFAVLDEARPTFGPATRALPQLPIGVDQEGFVVALGDFTAPVGADFWTRP